MAAGRSSTGISPRPILMGAPRNALRAFNAGVSLSCLCILAHRLPYLFCGLVLSLTCLVGVPSCGLATGSWRTGRPAPHRQIVSVCLMLPAGFLCQGSWTPLPDCRGKERERNLPRTTLDRQHLEARHDAMYQLRFQPAAQFFIHIGIRAAMDVIACPGGKRCYVAGIVADHRVYRVRLSPDSGGLPSAPLAADRLSACGR